MTESYKSTASPETQQAIKEAAAKHGLVRLTQLSKTSWCVLCGAAMGLPVKTTSLNALTTYLKENV